ncbi:MAG TPA: DeoR family transcriptional regulator [Candidatus Paceibacterota bacterium]
METEDDFLKNLPIELAHALFRVAESVRHQELKSRIETWGVTFLESSLLSDVKSIGRDIHILEHMIILGEAIGEIPYYSSEILRAQFEKVKSAIRQHNEERVAKLSISRLFSDNDNNIGIVNNNKLGVNSIESDSGGPPSMLYHEEVNPIFITEHKSKRNNLNASNSTERRDLIVKKIRQLGNAAMKDLIAEFESVSERTLRYDLQKLCDQSVLERMGNGGPASFYRLREIPVTAH